MGLLSLVLVSVFLVFGARGVHAAPASGTTVSPAVTEVNVDKGKSYTISMRVTNASAGDLTYTTETQDFEAKDETGDAKLLTDTSLTPAVSIRSWFTGLPKTLTIKAGQTATVPVQIVVPANATAGGHFGAIGFIANPTSGSGNVHVASEVSSLFLLTVNGPITENLTVASFDTRNADGTKHQGFFEYGPVTFVTRFKNEGNVQEQPVGHIDITNLFGHKTATLDMNKSAGNVLPSSIRAYTSTLKTKWLFGYYTAHMTAGYGTHGQVLTYTTGFWVVPYRVIILGLIILAIVVWVLRWLILRYNKHIIDKATHANKQQ